MVFERNKPRRCGAGATPTTSGVTTVVVSHRISVLTQADRILVLDEDALVDQGHHQDLLERCDVYAKAWRIQIAAEALTDSKEVHHE